MSCIHQISVKSVSVAGVKRAFIPCNKCFDCREKRKFSWQFRLRAEWLGLCKRPETWHCAFATLTYGTPKGGYPHDMRPRMPRCCYKNSSDYNLENPLYCFNKRHCRQLLDNFRVWLHQKYKITKEYRCRYILAAEYGETTHRPHYHVLLFYPMINGLTDESVYNFLKDFWEMRHGKFFPQKFNGGDRNKKGCVEKPFVVKKCDNCIENTIAYVSKYICKDLEFQACSSARELKTRLKIYKNYDSFCLCSKSIGSCFLEGCTDSELYDLYFNGYSFIGDERRRPLPVYLSNKIVYDNYYVFERQYDGSYKRMVRKCASSFFQAHYKEIHAKKSQLVYTAWKELGKRINNGVFHEGIDITSLMTRSYDMATESIDLHFLSSWSVSCYGRPFHVLPDAPLAQLYLSRYNNQVLGFLWDNYDSCEVSWFRNLSDRVCCLNTLIHILGSKEDISKDLRVLQKLLREDLRDL